MAGFQGRYASLRSREAEVSIQLPRGERKLHIQEVKTLPQMVEANP